MPLNESQFHIHMVKFIGHKDMAIKINRIMIIVIILFRKTERLIRKIYLLEKKNMS